MKALYDATRFTSATPNTTIAPFASEPVIANFAESAPSGPANRRSPEPDGTLALVIGAGPLTSSRIAPSAPPFGVTRLSVNSPGTPLTMSRTLLSPQVARRVHRRRESDRRSLGDVGSGRRRRAHIDMPARVRGDIDELPVAGERRRERGALGLTGDHVGADPTV